MARGAAPPGAAPAAAGAGPQLGAPAGLRRAARLSAAGVAGLLLGAAVAASAAEPPAAKGVTLPRQPPAPKTAGCLIEPDRWADVGSPVVGIVEAVGAERGDHVGRGQTLVQLRAAVEQATQTVAETRARADAEVRAAEVATELADQKAQRAVSLEAEHFISPQALETARSELQLARHRLEQARVQQRIWAEESRVAQAQLGQRTVRSPFDGIVVERFVNAGERVEDRPLMRVAVVDPLRVELMVPVGQWGRMKPGDVVSVMPELPGAAALAARVAMVDGVLDPASNTFRVRLSLPNPGHKLPAGLRCRADLDHVQSTPPAAESNRAPGAASAAASKAATTVAKQPVRKATRHAARHGSRRTAKRHAPPLVAQR